MRYKKEFRTGGSEATLRSIICTGICLVVTLTGLAKRNSLFAAGQQNKNPLAGDPNAIREGASQFRIDCALCHGLDARGGNRGPDLTRGIWAHGGTDADLFRTINMGISGTLMPANDLSEAETWEIIAYLRSLTPEKPRHTGGDPNAGEKLFFGDANCSLCHMVRGKGGRLGPDLSRVGNRRSPDFLTQKLREPDANLSPTLMDSGKERPYDAQAVTVVTQDGERIQGIIRNEDSFTVQLMDLGENLHSYFKKDLREMIHEEKSLMPAYGKDALSEKQLCDIVTYLDQLRGDSDTERE